MDKMNDNPGLDFDTAGASESAHTDTAGNSVAGPATPASSTPKNPTLLNQWFFMQKVVSDPKLSRCSVACAFTWLIIKTTGWALRGPVTRPLPS